MLTLIILNFFIQGLTLEYELTVEATQVYCDELNNAYLVNNDHLEKRGRQGRLMNEANFKRYGAIYNLDVTNSFKPLIFYQDQAELVMMDNMLSFSGDPIDMIGNNMGQISLVCHSQDQHFWLYDKSFHKLIRTNNFLEPITTSGFVYQLIGFQIEPVFMVESRNNVFLVDPEKGVFIFDLFGNFERSISVTGLQRVQVLNQSMYYMLDGEFYRYNLKLQESKKIDIPVEEIKDVSISKSNLFVLTADKLQVYSFNPQME